MVVDGTNFTIHIIKREAPTRNSQSKGTETRPRNISPWKLAEGIQTMNITWEQIKMRVRSGAY